MSKNKKTEPIKSTVFKIGDLVSNQYGDLKVIIDVLDNDQYRFMHLCDSYGQYIDGIIHTKKGDISTQPCCIFDQYNLLYQHKKQ